MPQKLSKSRKKAVKSTKTKKQKSFLNRFFTFPVIAIIAFAALSTFTLYKVTEPSKNVLGVSTSDYMLVNQTEKANIIKSAKTSGETPPTFHYIHVFKDANNNGKRGTVEDCLDKTVTLVVNNKERTAWACNDITIYTKNRYATITLKAVSGYKFIGLTYKDSTTGSGSVTKLNGANSIYVKGIPTGYPQAYYYTAIDFGVHKK